MIHVAACSVHFRWYAYQWRVWLPNMSDYRGIALIRKAWWRPPIPNKSREAYQPLLFTSTRQKFKVSSQLAFQSIRNRSITSTFGQLMSSNRNSSLLNNRCGSVPPVLGFLFMNLTLSYSWVSRLSSFAWPVGTWRWRHLWSEERVAVASPTRIRLNVSPSCGWSPPHRWYPPLQPSLSSTSSLRSCDRLVTEWLLSRNLYLQTDKNKFTSIFSFF